MALDWLIDLVFNWQMLSFDFIFPDVKYYTAHWEMCCVHLTSIDIGRTIKEVNNRCTTRPFLDRPILCSHFVNLFNSQEVAATFASWCRHKKIDHHVLQSSIWQRLDVFLAKLHFSGTEKAKYWYFYQLLIKISNQEE